MSARKAGEVDYGGCSQEQLLHFLRLRDRQATTSRQFWVRAAKAALGGDDRELHNRVELAEAGPVTITNGDTEYTFAAPATDEAAAEIDALRTRAETAESSLASTLASVDGMREALDKLGYELGYHLLSNIQRLMRERKGMAGDLVDYSGIEVYDAVHMVLQEIDPDIYARVAKRYPDAAAARALSAGPNDE